MAKTTDTPPAPPPFYPSPFVKEAKKVKKVKKVISFQEYSDDAWGTAMSLSKKTLWYNVLGLCGEAGELSEKVKKFYRDDGYRDDGYRDDGYRDDGYRDDGYDDRDLDVPASDDLGPAAGESAETAGAMGTAGRIFREAVLKEAGDVLWYLNACLRRIGFTLEDAARANMEKRADRRARGVLGGSGDNR